MSGEQGKSTKRDTSDGTAKSSKPNTSDGTAKSSKPNTSEEESKLEKLLGNLEKVKSLLEMTERDIILVSGKTTWKPVLSRGFEWITNEESRFKEAEQFFLNLGLGRGVDVTCTRPFHNKTAFQIKQVNHSKLIGTDEGGLLVEFNDTVYSTTDTSVKYQASLDVMKALGKHAGALAAVSAPFRFTASGELSRSKYSIGKVLGVRILNRTVSFQQTMDSVPTSLVRLTHLKHYDKLSEGVRKDTSPEREVEDKEKEQKAETERKQQEKETPHGTEQQSQDEEEDTFEERLSDWIREYYKNTKNKSAGQSKTGRMQKPKESGKGKAEKGEEDKIPLDGIADDTLETLCEAYTRTTGVTHYVSSIKLGAEMYKTMDLQAYQSTFKSNASVNVLDIFTTGDDKDNLNGTSVQRKEMNKRYATKVIGRITEVKQPKAAKTVPNPAPTDDDNVPKEEALNVHPRKSYKVDPRDEAVIGYELRSVASLINDERLAEKMALVARRYIEEKRREKVGPYYIASHDMESGKTIYLMKGKKSTLTTTTEQCEAAPFKIVPDEDDVKKEFHIVYEAKDEGGNDEDAQKGKGVDTPTFRYYLTTRHKFSGVHSEPPSLEQHPKESNATFALHSQLHEWINTQEKLEEWISEGECFLINCENRKWARDSYFALKRNTDGETKNGTDTLSHEFTPVCERYINENDDLLFAFKLIPCPYQPPKQQKKAADSPQE